MIRASELVSVLIDEAGHILPHRSATVLARAKIPVQEFTIADFEDAAEWLVEQAELIALQHKPVAQGLKRRGHKVRPHESLASLLVRLHNGSNRRARLCVG